MLTFSIASPVTSVTKQLLNGNTLNSFVEGKTMMTNFNFLTEASGADGPEYEFHSEMHQHRPIIRMHRNATNSSMRDVV